MEINISSNRRDRKKYEIRKQTANRNDPKRIERNDKKKGKGGFRGSNINIEQGRKRTIKNKTKSR